MDAEARLARLEERTENIQRDIADMKVDLRAVRDGLSVLAQKVASSEASIIKWMVGTAIASTSAAVTLAKFVS
jgi:hypothetical protein